MNHVSRVFVVYGRDTVTRDRIVNILSSLRTMPVFLEREAGTGQTIIELVEEFGDAKYSVAVMTSDDIGYLRDEPHAARGRARQNVVLEIGYMMGRLGRSRILLLTDDIEMPSDLAGVRHVRLSNTDEQIRVTLAREFQKLGDVGYQV